MSNLDFRQYVHPDRLPRLPKAEHRMSFTEHPQFLHRLLSLWGTLSREPFKGLTANGHVVEGLHRLAPSGAPAEAAANAAHAWLASLPEPTKSQVCLPLDAAEWRQWHNTPLILRPTQHELETLSGTQRRLALEVIAASLSTVGYQRTREVMRNNQFLGELVDRAEVLNEWRFSLCLFGVPSSSEPWGWQFFGHHLALNCLFIGGHMVVSPVFMGLEPDHGGGELGRRMFEPHERQGLALIHSLHGPELDRAILYRTMRNAEQPPGRYDPDDGRVQGGAFRDNRVVPYEGVPVANLGARQRRLLLELAELFVENLPAGPAQARMQDVDRHLDQTYFAWIGPADDVNPFYYRIHSPVILIEFDHHSGIFLTNQNPERFHVHTVVRTPNGGDYGMDLLQLHYSSAAHGANAHGTHSHDGGQTFHTHR